MGGGPSNLLKPLNQKQSATRTDKKKAFNFYMRQLRSYLKKENPNLTTEDIKELGKTLWKSFTQQEKQVYLEEQQKREREKQDKEKRRQQFLPTSTFFYVRRQPEGKQSMIEQDSCNIDDQAGPSTSRRCAVPRGRNSTTRTERHQCRTHRPSVLEQGSPQMYSMLSCAVKRYFKQGHDKKKRASAAQNVPHTHRSGSKRPVLRKSPDNEAALDDDSCSKDESHMSRSKRPVPRKSPNNEAALDDDSCSKDESRKSRSKRPVLRKSPNNEAAMDEDRCREDESIVGQENVLCVHKSFSKCQKLWKTPDNEAAMDEDSCSEDGYLYSGASTTSMSSTQVGSETAEK